MLTELYPGVPLRSGRYDCFDFDFPTVWKPEGVNSCSLPPRTLTGFRGSSGTLGDGRENGGLSGPKVATHL